jgi:hypothetical protein
MNRNSLPGLVLLTLAIPAVAQQVEEEVLETPDVKRSMIIAADDGSGAMPRIAIMSSDGSGMNSFAWGMDVAGMPAPDIFALAQNDGVQKEIELVDEQLGQLRQINEDFSARIQEQMESIRGQDGTFDMQRAKDLSELIRKLNEEKEARMREVFLPHQFDRLRQISLQTQMKRNGETSMLSNSEVVEALGLSDEQQKRLKKKAAELKTEMEQEIRKLKEKAREELFEELTRDQREKLKSMLGEDFEVKSAGPLDRLQRIRNRQRTEDN